MGFIFSSLSLPASWHLLTWGLLLGTQFFQTFVNGIISFRSLPRTQFSVLQQNIFPWYFRLQTVLPIITLLTTPGLRSASDILAYPSPLSTGGLLLTVITATVNLAVVGPATTSIMKERKARETREGKKYYDEGPKSAEMAALNKRFSTMHGVSSVLNLVSLFATAQYGLVLGEKLVR